MRARALVVGALVLALLALAIVRGLREDSRYSGSNSVGPKQGIIELRDGQRVCQSGELVPADTAAVEVSVATGGGPGPPLAVRLRAADKRVLGRGKASGGYRDGLVSMPIPLQRRTRTGVEVCVERTGRGTALLYGLAGAEGKLKLDGKRTPGVLRLAYRRPGKESWLALTPAIAHRFAQAKTRIAAPWMFYVLIAFSVLAAGLALQTVVREEEAP
jgi:hypothetical protein